MGFFLPHLNELIYLLGIPHLHENRPIVASSSVLWVCESAVAVPRIVAVTVDNTSC